MGIAGIPKRRHPGPLPKWVILQVCTGPGNLHVTLHYRLFWQPMLPYNPLRSIPLNENRSAGTARRNTFWSRSYRIWKETTWCEYPGAKENLIDTERREMGRLRKWFAAEWLCSRSIAKVHDFETFALLGSVGLVCSWACLDVLKTVGFFFSAINPWFSNLCYVLLKKQYQLPFFRFWNLLYIF